MGWDERHPTSHVVSCKRLRNEGLHTLLGMVGYYKKDNKEKHFEFIHHNVYTNDMNKGKVEYAKFSKVGLNNCESIT